MHVCHQRFYIYTFFMSINSKSKKLVTSTVRVRGYEDMRVTDFQSGPEFLCQKY